MKSRLVDLPTTTVVGLSFYGNPFAGGAGWTDENEIGRLWKRFMGLLEADPQAIKNRVDPDVSIEFHHETAETKEKGFFELVIGVPVSRLEDVPLECIVKVLPAGNHMVFTLEGDEIRSDWPHAIHEDHLPKLGYESAHPFIWEQYDSRFRGLDRIGESELDIYVPVRALR